MSEAAQGAPSDPVALRDRVLDVVCRLVSEVGGERRGRAVTPDASLERELGLGSLERVELLGRLETALGRRLDDRFLRLDSVDEITAALVGAAPASIVARAPVAAAREGLGPAQGARLIHEPVWTHAAADPGRTAVHVHEDDEPRPFSLSYAELAAAAAAVAGGLRARGIRPGDRVAILLPTGRDFLRTFLGILAARAVAVPLYPPFRLDRLAEYAERQSTILRDAGARLLVTLERARPVAARLQAAVPGLEAVVDAESLAGEGAAASGLDGQSGDPALIQYTSGSTGRPKGVSLTHGQLLANVRAVSAGLEARATDVGVSWLPLYHDMGLIGSWLFCQYQGIPITLLSPVAFLTRPERWLWTLHEQRGTLSAAPNFAYELCARRIPDAAVEGLDLSAWRCALNGAEPVSPDTLERFHARFARYGLRREALMPVYGLAETCVGLSFPPPGRGPRVDRVQRPSFESSGRAEPAATDGDALRFVSVGRPLPGHELRIVDDAGTPLGERQMGRIVFRGPSSMTGYFGRPEATAAITLEDGWLDSGDLGYLAGGELHVAGRRKDLIIKAGRNLVPQELEEAVAEVDGVRRGCVAAFGIPDERLGTESLVVVAETRERDADRRESLVASVTDRITLVSGIPPDAVVLVAPGSVPKTSSGKIRRAESRRLYLEGSLGRRPSRWRGRVELLPWLVAGKTASAARAVRRGTYAVYLGLVAVAVGALAWLAAALVPSGRAALAIERWTARVALALMGCPIRIDGPATPAARGGMVLACNHASYLDVLALRAALPWDFRFVAKSEVLGWPFVGLLMRKSGHLSVDREDASDGLATTRRVAEAVGSGHQVLLFPEATFSAARGLRAFRLGAFQVAAQTGAPIVPLALRGTREVLRDGTWLPCPREISVWIGEPIRPAAEGWSEVVSLRDRVAETIAAHCGEPRLDVVAGRPREAP